MKKHKQKKEFYPNTFQSPRCFVDNGIMAGLSGNEVKMMIAIIRKTYGWFKESDKIARSQMVEMTGMDEKSIKPTREKLIKKGLIEYYPEKGNTPGEYKIIEDLFLPIEKDQDKDIQEGEKLPLQGGNNTPSVIAQEGEKLPPQGGNNTPHKTYNNNTHDVNSQTYDIEPDKPVSLRTRVTLLFDEYYESIYNEKFSWGSKQKSARYGREVSEIIANAGNYDDEEILQKIESKMLILRWFGETKNQDFWKFNYANLANKWNELTVPFDPDIDKYKKLIAQWNKLTGQIIDLTPGLVSMFSVAKCRHNLTVVQKAVLAKAVNEFDIKNNTRNLSILIADKNGQLLTYSGKYDGENMRGLIEKKLNSNHEDHNPFPEISYKSDINELLAYDWMQHGIDSLSRYVIGRDGYNEIKNGGDIKKIIEKIYDQKLTEYMKGGLLKNEI